MKQIITSATSFPWSNKIGVARSLLAIGTFMTLAFNDIDMLFFPLGEADTIDLYQSSPFLDDINIFNIFSDNIQIAKIICLLVLALTFTGWRPRYTCILHWWITWSFATKAVVQDGGDQVSQVLTLLLIPICLADGRKWHWAEPQTPSNDLQKHFSIISWFAMILIALQISVLYLEAATAKFNVEEWANGTSMFYWIQNPIFGINEYLSDVLTPIFANAIVVTVATYGALLLEILLFMAIIMKPSHKKVFMWTGILFHFAIVILFGLVSFFFAMSAALILYLGPENGFDFKWEKPQLFMRMSFIKH